MQPEVKKELEMRSTFKILFYVNKGKEKDGIVPIMGRITINGTQCQFSCKHSIPLAMWDVKGNCAKGRSKEALQIFPQKGFHRSAFGRFSRKRRLVEVTFFSNCASH